MNRATLQSLDIRGQTVLLRADLNIPISKDSTHEIESSDQRLRLAIPTIRYLMERNCKVIICSHLGRPKGDVVEDLRMDPISARLGALLGGPVTQLDQCIGPTVKKAIEDMNPGDLALLENLRFYPGEEANEPEFAKALASLSDVFIQDAFGASHRLHASIVGVPLHIPSAAGLLLEKELDILGAALNSPSRPLAILMGGAKISDKIKLLENLITKVDAIFVGGGMAATLLKSQGKSVGASLVEEDMVPYADDLIARIKQKGIHLYLPYDLVVSSTFSRNPHQIKNVHVDHIPDDSYIMDIGTSTRENFSTNLSRFNTIIWNGPMGVYEFEHFSKGTKSVSSTLAALDATTIIGGGSTAHAIQSLNLHDQITHVSSGGGAMIKFMEGNELPGVSALPLIPTQLGVHMGQNEPTQ